MRIFKTCIEENIYIVELRHIFGFVFDDDRKAIEVKGELEIFDKCLKAIQVNYPIFWCKIITCGLKVLGKDHIQKQIDDMIEGKGMEDYKYLLAAYDMVNEEDTTPGIQEFAQLIMKAQEK